MIIPLQQLEHLILKMIRRHHRLLLLPLLLLLLLYLLLLHQEKLFIVIRRREISPHPRREFLVSFKEVGLGLFILRLFGDLLVVFEGVGDFGPRELLVVERGDVEGFDGGDRLFDGGGFVDVLDEGLVDGAPGVFHLVELFEVDFEDVAVGEKRGGGRDDGDGFREMYFRLPSFDLSRRCRRLHYSRDLHLAHRML